MDRKKDRTGVMLAGGKSRRFGSPKAFAMLDGKPFYEYSLEALEPLTHTQVIITSRELKDRFKETGLSLQMYTDHAEFAGKGPLAGIYTAMEQVKSEWYVTVPIDVPYITAAVIEHLLCHARKETDAVIPIAAGRMHPLIAVYHRSVKDKLEQNLKNNQLSVKELLDKLEVKYVHVLDERPFMNINSQADFHQIKTEE